METVRKVARELDAKRDLLLLIKAINPAFYNEFVREFFTDPLTYIGFEKDLFKALAAVKGITIAAQDPRDSEDNGVILMYADVIVEFDCYEDAIVHAIRLLHAAL